jgi:YjbE family integral membrane protein
VDNIYNDFVTLFEYKNLLALVQIIIIDFVLAGDNAIVVGLAASRVAPELRMKVIFWGIAGAVVLRVMFAAVATQLLTIVGLTLAGGILLLWVCWKMYREISSHQPHAQPAMAGGAPADGMGAGSADYKGVSVGAAILQVIIADVSMSLDNVLAVAGAARGNIVILAIGLTVAIVFMAVASAYIAKLLARYFWITWIGLAVILYVALEMIWKGTHQVGCSFVPQAVCDSGFLATLSALF